MSEYRNRLEKLKSQLRKCVEVSSSKAEYEKSLEALSVHVKQAVSKDIYMEVDTAFREVLAESLLKSSSEKLTMDSEATKLILVGLDIGTKVFVTNTIELGNNSFYRGKYHVLPSLCVSVLSL